jgi:hypothetical protein
MRVAILCPGPSFLLFDGHYETVIAVNKAAERCYCDVWVCPDGEKGIKPCGVTGDIVSSYEYRKAIMMNHPDPLWNGPWADFSAGWAVAYAAVVLGAKRIDAYGMDMAGDKYWDGSQQYSDKPATRWDNERRHINLLATALYDRGIVFHRAGCADTVEGVVARCEELGDLPIKYLTDPRVLGYPPDDSLTCSDL